MELSIIIPTLNEENYLSLLLESIKKQNFERGYEIIVSDADSRDRTLEIAGDYGCKVTKGGLPAKGRNEGAKVAKGEIFLFLDADIILPTPLFFKKTLEEFEKRNLSIASFPLIIQGNKFDKFFFGIYNLWANLTQNFFAHASQAILVKREIHQKIGGFDKEIRLGEDHIYAREGNKYGKFGFLKNETILASARRLERDGRIVTYLKYFLAGFYMTFFGPVKSDIFNYKFGHYFKKNKI